MKRIVLPVLVVCLFLVAGCRSAGKKADGPRSTELPATIQTLPSQTVLALAHTGPYEGMTETIDRLFSFMEQQGIQPTGELMGVFWDDPMNTPAEECRYEVRIPVAPGTEVDAPFVVKTIPPTATAGVALVGSYEKIAEEYGKLYTWIREHGYRVAGPLVEVYLVHPGSGVPPAEYQTEVHVPIEPAN